MEGKSSRDRPEKCTSTGSKPAYATTACKPKAKLRRHKSLEDLRSLKSTQEQHMVSIFLEYVHVRKQSNNAPARAEMPELGLNCNSTEAQVSTRPTMCSYRRLRSEPNGSDNSIRDAANGKSERGELLQTNHSRSASKRPCTLTLEPQHKRVPSSDSSCKTTPAPDPPLFSPNVCELQITSTCLAENQQFQRSRSASSPILPPSHMEAQVGTPQSQRHLCAAQSGLPPLTINSGDTQRHIYSRLIADRIRSIGDRYAMQFDEHQLERKLASLIFNQSPASTGFTSKLTTLRGCLSWQRVSEIFSIGYYLLEVLTTEFGPNVNKLPQEDKRWTLFQKLWDVMMNAVAPWIWEQGGWAALLEANEKMEGADITMSTGATAFHTPPMEPLSSPALGTRRHRLWSLSESGTFVDEEGNTMKEVGFEQEVVRHDQQQEESLKMSSENLEVYHQESADLQGMTLTFESDSPFCCPSEHVHLSSPPFLLLSCTPGDLPPHSQDESELLDSGIASEQLSLETHDVDSLFNENIHTASSPEQFTMTSSSSSNDVTVETSNGEVALENTHFQRKSSSMKEKGSPSSKRLLPLDRNRSRSLPGSHNGKGRGRRRPVKSAPVKRLAAETTSRRTSETALTGLFYTVNISASAAFVYAAVSALMN